MVELLTHIAKNDNEMSYLGHGYVVWCKRWNDMGVVRHRQSSASSTTWPVHPRH